MAQLLDHLPELEGDEAAYISRVLKEMDDKKAERFTSVYRARRKDPQIILFSALAGFLGVAGVHRLLIGHIGMGVLYLLTGGLCVIGTIVDLINYKTLAFEYNRSVAQEVRSLID